MPSEKLSDRPLAERVRFICEDGKTFTASQLPDSLRHQVLGWLVERYGQSLGRVIVSVPAVKQSETHSH